MRGDAAFQQALTQYLSADSALLTAAPAGVWFDRVGSGASGTACLWEWHHVVREQTFGGEAWREIYFRVKARWCDADGANYANGNAVLERVLYLLDGAEAADSKRVHDALNAYLNPLGWRVGRCYEMTSLPPVSFAIGEDESALRWTMGHVFYTRIERVH